MVIACWSVKGGSGTSVVAASLALILAERSQPPGALLVDLAGDAAAVLGLAEPATGVREWLAAGDTAPADSLAVSRSTPAQPSSSPRRCHRAADHSGTR